MGYRCGSSHINYGTTLHDNYIYMTSDIPIKLSYHIFFLLTSLLACNLQPSEQAKEATSNNYTVSQPCDYNFSFCDTCFLLSDFVKWEKMRGAQEVLFDKDSHDISMGGKGYSNPGSWSLDNYVAFLYQEESSFLRQLVVYKYDIFHNEATGVDTAFVTYIHSKYFHRSDYLERHLKSNRFVLDGRKSVGRLDTHLIENNIELQELRDFSFPKLYNSFLCLADFVEAEFQVDLETQPSKKSTWTNISSDFIDSMLTFDINILEYDLDDETQKHNNELESNLSIFSKSFYRIAANISFSENNHYVEQKSSLYAKDNTAIYLVFVANDSEDSFLRQRLKKLGEN